MIRSLQSIRFYLAVMIFLNHLNYLCFFKGGQTWYSVFYNRGNYMVTFFFLLSGFCIALGYGDKFETLQSKTYLQFVWKRIKRIYPLYAVTMIVVYAMKIYQGQDVVTSTRQLLLGLTMLQTITTKNWGILNSAAWYMSCIFLLYLVTPLILHIFYKKKPGTLLLSLAGVWLVMCAVIAGGYHIFSVEEWNLFTYVTPYVRIFIYTAGLLTGKLYKIYQDKKLWEGSIAEVAMLGLCIIAYIAGMYKDALDPVTTIFYVPVFALFLMVLSREKGIVARFLNRREQVWLGGLSMDIYLLHYVIAMYLQEPFYKILSPERSYSVYLFILGLFALTMLLALVSNKATALLFAPKKPKKVS